jgi:uncharacterized protein (TIGR00288 family)
VENRRSVSEERVNIQVDGEIRTATHIVQKEVDVAMACRMVTHAMKDSYDVAVVVSGDRDFVPAIEAVQEAGKRAEVASFEETFSKEMLKVCDTYHKLDSMPIIRIDTRMQNGAAGEKEEQRWIS